MEDTYYHKAYLEHPVGVGVTVPGQEAHITLVRDAKLALGELKIAVPGYSFIFLTTIFSIILTTPFCK